MENDRIKISYGDKYIFATKKEIKDAAKNGMDVILDEIPCKVAANWNGWITAVTDKGLILQGWAGEFIIN